MDYDTALAIAGVVGDVNTLNAAFAARLDKLDGLMVHLHRDHHEGVVARIEALERHIERVYNDMAFQDSRLNALKGETAEWIDGLQGEDTRQAARLDELELSEIGTNRTLRIHIEDIADLARRLDRQGRRIKHLEEGKMRRLLQVDDRLKALERHIERVYNDMAFQDSRLDKLNKRITRESNMLGRDLTALAERVAQLEQAAKDQARNSNASAIAFNGRLDRQGAALQILREEVAELENNLARKERNMLIERVEELEGAENGQPPDEEIGF